MAHYFVKKEIPDNYIERGVEKGAKFVEGNVDNADMLRIFETTKPFGLDDAWAWIEKHREDFSETTLAIDIDDVSEISNNIDSKLKVVVQERGLHQIRHLNTLLNRINEMLDDGGYLWCHAQTSVLKRQMIIDRYPRGINYIIFGFHVLWHRMIPRTRVFKKFYFAVTKGKDRAYHRVEILGRMCRSGFEIVDEGFRHGEFFILARKIREPIRNDSPSGSPIIKLPRIGRDGKYIKVYKFRTMYPYSEYMQSYVYEHNHLQQGGKFADDYRITPWGKWMRKLWIDELPMLFNFIKGDLKLVGVRPLSQQYFSLYAIEMQRLRASVKPGLIPPFYYDRHTPKTIEEVQASERRYIEAYRTHPFKTDLKYFFGTIGNIIFRGKTSK